MNKYEDLEICSLDSVEKNVMLIYVNGRAFKTDAQTADVAAFFKENADYSNETAAEQLGMEVRLVAYLRKNIDALIEKAQSKKQWNRRLHFVFFKWKLHKNNVLITVLSHLYCRKATIFLTAAGIAACFFWLYQSSQAQLFNGFPTALLRHLTPAFFLYSYPLMSLFMLCHECGHAAALRHYNEMPSEMGGGLYFLHLTFFCNVNASWKLKRRERAVVSIGGIYFELLLGIAIVPVFLLFQHIYPAAASFFRTFMLFIYLNVLHNVYPALYSDGYWLAIDLFGIQSAQQTAAAFIKKIFRKQETTILDNLNKPALVALFIYTVFSNGVFAFMTCVMLKYTYIFLGITVPQYVMYCAALTVAQYTELFWGSLLTVSVVLMLIRALKKLPAVIPRVRHYITGCVTARSGLFSKS